MRGADAGYGLNLCSSAFWVGIIYDKCIRFSLGHLQKWNVKGVTNFTRCFKLGFDAKIQNKTVKSWLMKYLNFLRMD